MKRYPDCQFEHGGDCAACSCSSYGKDCHGAPTNQLAYMRTRAGMTQQQLSQKTGLTITYLSKLETGDRTRKNVRLSSAIKIADALGITDVRLMMDSSQAEENE